MIDRWRLRNKCSLIAVILLLPRLACAEPLTLGFITASPTQESKKISLLANYLARQLQSEGIGKGNVVAANSIEAMSSLLRMSQADIFIDGFFPTMAVSRLSGSKLLLRRWKNGGSGSKSVIFTRKDSRIAILEHLGGKVIAFDEPFSSFGYFVPKVELLKITFMVLPNRPGSGRVKGDEVRYIFSGGDTNTIYKVANGEVAAGAVADQRYHALVKNLAGLTILHETAPAPRQLVSHRADLPVTLVTKIKNILLNMTRTEEGREVLREFHNTTKFDEIPAPVHDLMMGLKKYVEAELKPQSS
jgi:phosphonate transport system substrate-binding protein